MTVSEHSAPWPPRIGDYARVRHNQRLVEVIDVIGPMEDRWYVLNLLVPAATAPATVRLKDLAPIWRCDAEADPPISGRSRSRRMRSDRQ